MLVGINKRKPCASVQSEPAPPDRSSALQIWLVRNTTCRPSGLAWEMNKERAVTPVQAAVQQGKQLLVGLARKFLRSGAALLGAM